ncbi:MAG: IS1182 family transposase [Alkalinema sp. RL_2_19]|nr:IS1182 family transposase [Alkalinema sp. RL_2_19]
MSLHPQTDWTIPARTIDVARAAFPKGNIYLKMRDHLGHLYEDAEFATLFRQDCGASAYSPAQLALVSVMQFAEGLSDRQAADAVRGRIDWKYALGLELTDTGFDYSLLSEFRQRLVSGERALQLLDTMLSQFQGQGWLKGGGKGRTDSTRVLAATRHLNRLEVVGETLRHALEVLAVVAGDWLKGQVTPEWFERYGTRIEASRLPKEKSEQAQYFELVGEDGHQLLAAVYGADAPPYLAQISAVETLRRVWVQQYWIEVGKVMLRPPGEMPPASDLIQSPYDLEARNRTKRKTNWTGYTVQVSETCEPDLPHLITHIETTPATTADSNQTLVIHQALADKNLLPGEHFVDTAYVSAVNLYESAEAGIDLVGPAPSDHSWQALEPDGLDLTQFSIDWTNQQVTCPAGQVSQQWQTSTLSDRIPVIKVKFDKATCQACPLHSRCTRSPTHPRMLKFRSQPLHEALSQARQRQSTPEFQQRYRNRAGIEGTISLACCHFDMRRSRYIGLAKTHLQNGLTAAAINLSRMLNWLDSLPRAQTRVSHFARLALPQ